MTCTKAERAAPRPPRSARLFVSLLVAGAISGAVVHLSGAPPVAETGHGPSRPSVGARPVPPPFGSGSSARGGSLGIANGAVPPATTPFDAIPAVTRLDAELRHAVRRAAKAAAADGVRITLNSGWRSRAYQQHLLRDAIARHGSTERAYRWVAPADRSSHVSGRAVDIGGPAVSWLSRHGAAYGLCQIYANEPWHFELRDAAGGRCPPPYADPTHDPRMWH